MMPGLAITGAKEAIRSYANARTELLAAWKDSLEAELNRGVKDVQKNYRNFSSDGPSTLLGTRRQTGTLISSYNYRVTQRGNQLVGEMGLLNGKLAGAKKDIVLRYGRVWELGGQRKGGKRIAPRPAAGALNLAAIVIRPRLLARFKGDVAAWKARRANG